MDDSRQRGAAGTDNEVFNKRRTFVGGGILIGSVLGFAAVQAVVDAGAVSDEWVLVALPAFGIVAVIGFVLFVSAVVPG